MKVDEEEVNQQAKKNQRKSQKRDQNKLLPVFHPLFDLCLICMLCILCYIDGSIDRLEVLIVKSRNDR